MKQIYLLDNKITLIDAKRLNKEIKNIVNSDRKQIILNVNIHGINLANKHKWLKEFRNSCYIVFCDGQGVILGAKVLGEKIPERITYADWLWDFSSYCAQEKISVFLLGTRQEIIEGAAKKLKEKNHNLIIRGFHHGFFSKTGSENKKVIDIINQAEVDVLIIGFGMPIQEKWLKDNWKKINAKVFLVGGACFDYVSGYLRRGPKIFTNCGLEWLCRLTIEPKRLWKRYLVGNTVFFTKIFKEKITRLLNKNDEIC